MFSKLAHLFLPHHTNNHRPRILHNLPLFIIIGLLVALQSGLSILTQLYPNVLGYASSIPPERIIELTNQKRQEQGLTTLEYDPKLADAARRKAADMFQRDYWAHNSPDGTKPWSFIIAAGYNYLHAGENLARDFKDPQTVVDAWMASPTHKDNLLNPRYKHIGVAVVDGRFNGVETTLVVQMFGTPQSFNPKVVGEGSSIVAPAVAGDNTALPEAEASIPEAVSLPTPTPLPQIYSSYLTIFNTFSISKIITLAFIVLILLVLAVDWYIAYDKNLIRITGRNWAHITFIAAIAIITLILKQGVIT